MHLVLTIIVLAFLAYGVWKDTQGAPQTLDQELEVFLSQILTAA